MDDLFCTADVLQTKIIDVFASFGVSESDVINKIIFTTDRGSNIKSALKRIFCTAHYISNLVGLMCKIKDVKPIVKNAAKLVKYLKRSGLNSHKTMKNSSIKSYCKTRWNTVYDMLKSIVSNYTKIVKVLEAKESEDKTNKTKVLDKITRLPREKMEKIGEFLEFFKKLTLDIEFENKPVIHRVWPLFKRLDLYLEHQSIDSNVITKMKEAGRNYIQKEENIIDMQPNTELKLAVFLHPLMKRMKFVTEIERNDIQNEARKLMEAINLNVEPSEILNAEQREIDFNDIRLDREQSLIDEFCDEIEILHGNNEFSLNTETEMINYLNYRMRSSPNQNIDNFDLIGWWVTNKISFPRLFAIFLRLSSIQASSASSERCFSYTGSIKSARRANLKSSTINDIMLARTKLDQKQ